MQRLERGPPSRCLAKPADESAPTSTLALVQFGPLTGLEVRSNRIDGVVLVVEVAISINLASLTIEQVRAVPAVT